MRFGVHQHLLQSLQIHSVKQTTLACARALWEGRKISQSVEKGARSKPWFHMNQDARLGVGTGNQTEGEEWHWSRECWSAKQHTCGVEIFLLHRMYQHEEKHCLWFQAWLLLPEGLGTTVYYWCESKSFLGNMVKDLNFKSFDHKDDLCPLQPNLFNL